MIGKLLVEIFGDALGPRIRITANKFTWNNDGSVLCVAGETAVPAVSELGRGAATILRFQIRRLCRLVRRRNR